MNFPSTLSLWTSKKIAFPGWLLSICVPAVLLTFAGSAVAQDNNLDWGNKDDGAILDNTGNAYDWIDETSGNGYSNGDNTTSATYDNVDGTDRDITLEFNLIPGSNTPGSSQTLLDLFNADGDRNETTDDQWNSGDDYVLKIQPDEGFVDDKTEVSFSFSDAVNEVDFTVFGLDKSPWSAPDGSTLIEAVDNGTEINEINIGWIDQVTVTGTRLDGKIIAGTITLSDPSLQVAAGTGPGVNPYENQTNPNDYVLIEGNTATGRWTSLAKTNEDDPLATPENELSTYKEGDPEVETDYWDPEGAYHSSLGDVNVVFDAPVTDIQIVYENVWNNNADGTPTNRDGGVPPAGELEPYYDAHSNDFGLSDLGFTPFEDSQIVFDTTGEGGTLDGTMDANGGSDNLDQGSLFLNSPVAVNVDINSTSNQATTYTVTADPTLTVTGDDGSISEIGGADETDTLGLTLDTSTLGNVTGTATLDNTDATSDPSSNGAIASNRFGIYDDDDAITVSADVYAHSNGSFASGSDDNDTTLSFGTITDGGAGAQNDSVDLYNLPATDVPNGDSTPNTDANSIAYTVDLGYTVDSITGADAAAFDSTANGEITPNTSDGVSVTFDPTDPSVDHLGTYTATVNIAPEDTNLNADGFAGPDTGANLNDSSNLTIDVTAVMADSQVTFDTDTTDGAGANGQQTNGSTSAISLGNVFLGEGTLEQEVGVNNTGNENTTFDVAVGSGDALIDGATSALNNQNATGNATPTDITQPVTFDAGLDATTLGDKVGTITLGNDDTTTAIAGLDQGNGTGVGYGAEDSQDTLNLKGSVYAHSNGSFDGATDDNSETIAFGNYTGGAASQDVEIHNLPTSGSTTHTVDMRYDVGTPAGDAGQFDLSNLTAAEDIEAGTSTGALGVDFTPTALGSFSSTVTLSPEDHNLTPLGLETSPDHNGSGPNVNDDPAGLTLTVTGTALDSQVTFDTDTSDGAGSLGQQTNGSTTNLDLGNYFQNAAVSTTVGVNNTGNENTTFDLSVAGGDALINGGVAPLVNQGATGQNPVDAIAQSTTFAAGLDSSVTGSISGTIDLNNDDSATAVSGLDQGNGTGLGYGAEDSTDTLSLAANIYEHSNSSFSGVTDQNTLTLDFGTVDYSTGVYDLGFSVSNLAGSNQSYTMAFESTGISGGTSFLYTDLAPIDGLSPGGSLGYTASFDTTNLDTGFYTTTITISGLDDDEYIALVNSLSGGADLPTGYNPGDLTLVLQGEVVPEPSSAILLSLFGLVWLFRRPRRATNA